MRISSTFHLLLLLGPCAALLPERSCTAHIRKTRGSTSWISNRACRWLGICEKTAQYAQLERERKAQHQEFLTDKYKLLKSKERADTSDQANKIPTYVLDYAPLVYLHSGEKFWPCDITEHLKHVTPHLNYTPMAAASTGLNLTNLDKLNEYTNGRFVYLTSDDNVEERPDWLEGEKNIPDDPQELSKKVAVQRPLGAGGAAGIHGGHSDAPAVLVVVNKGHGIVDAFWFFFYSYNLGNLVFNVRFGNHIGDWEHTLVRFINGKPKYVFVSEHYFGQAYTYDAVEKLGKRVSQVHPQTSQPKLTMPQACDLLCRGHTCHVRHIRSAPIRLTTRSSPRPDRPRSIMGPDPQLSHLQVRPRRRFSLGVKYHAQGTDRMVLLQRSLGR